MIGVELLGDRCIAAVVDDAGRVVSRADGGPADLKNAALSAMSRLPVSAATGVGVASTDPESAASMAAMTALSAKHGGGMFHDPPISSGTAAAAAETWIGAARGASDVVYFAVSEHASAGYIRNGVPWAGAHRRSPAVGWLALNPVEREDYRKVGCLEAEAAAQGIVRRLIWRIKAGDPSRVQETVKGDLAAVTVGHVLEAARDGDAVSISVMRDTAKYLGMAAANLVAIADPAVLVLGGFMAAHPDLLYDPVRAEIARRLPAPIMQSLAIAPAALGADGPVIGAVRLAAAALP